MEKEELIKSLEKKEFGKEIIKAFKKVNRTIFVPKESKELTYEDTALSIGSEQTISQPSTIAFMLNLLDIKEGQKILEIGSGSGYVLALLAEMNKEGTIIGVERIKELAKESKPRLKKYKNVKIIHGNALTDIKDQKFDRILVSASFKEIPKEIIEKNLNTNGIFVGPVKNSIVKLSRESGDLKVREFYGFSFVPIVSEED